MQIYDFLHSFLEVLEAYFPLRVRQVKRSQKLYLLHTFLARQNQGLQLALIGCLKIQRLKIRDPVFLERSKHLKGFFRRVFDHQLFHCLFGLFIAVLKLRRGEKSGPLQHVAHLRDWYLLALLALLHVLQQLYQLIVSFLVLNQIFLQLLLIPAHVYVLREFELPVLLQYLVELFECEFLRVVIFRHRHGPSL